MTETSEKLSYFGIQSKWGVTKHLGGMAATHQVARLCGLGPGKKVLEVGCGVGVTAVTLTKEYGCAVTAVDLNERMLDWSRKRAEKNGLAGKIEFRQANATALPYEDNTFDALITESVTAFTPDKVKTLAEYARVIKPRGIVALTEVTWMKTPVPEEMVHFMEVSMEGAKFLPPEEWQAAFTSAGLVELHTELYKMTFGAQLKSDMHGFNLSDIAHRISAMGEVIKMTIIDPEFRQFARGLTPSWFILTNMMKYMGYGIYTGKKPG